MLPDGGGPCRRSCPSLNMTRPRVPDDKRQRTAQACDSCKRRKQKVSLNVCFSFRYLFVPPLRFLLGLVRESQPLSLFPFHRDLEHRMTSALWSIPLQPPLSSPPPLDVSANIQRMPGTRLLWAHIFLGLQQVCMSLKGRNMPARSKQRTRCATCLPVTRHKVQGESAASQVSQYVDLSLVSKHLWAWAVLVPCLA